MYHTSTSAALECEVRMCKQARHIAEGCRSTVIRLCKTWLMERLDGGSDDGGGVPSQAQREGGVLVISKRDYLDRSVGTRRKLPRNDQNCHNDQMPTVVCTERPSRGRERDENRERETGTVG